MVYRNIALKPCLKYRHLLSHTLPFGASPVFLEVSCQVGQPLRIPKNHLFLPSSHPMDKGNCHLGMQNTTKLKNGSLFIDMLYSCACLIIQSSVSFFISVSFHMHNHFINSGIKTTYQVVQDFFHQQHYWPIKNLLLLGLDGKHWNMEIYVVIGMAIHTPRFSQDCQCLHIGVFPTNLSRKVRIVIHQEYSSRARSPKSHELSEPKAI